MSEMTNEGTMEIGDFHNRGGWYFKRLSDGGVRIRKTLTPYINSPVEHEHIIRSNEWASVIAHVSKYGESSESYSGAESFHDGADFKAAFHRLMGLLQTALGAESDAEPLSVIDKVTDLRSRLESAERDTARIEWLESHAGLVAGDLTPETPCRDAAFGWVKIPRFGDPQRALRDAIDAALAQSPSNQGKTNG